MASVFGLWKRQNPVADARVTAGLVEDVVQNQSMAAEEAERIVQEYADVLAEGLDDGLFICASLLPGSPETIMRAIKAILALQVELDCLTDEFQDRLGGAASCLPRFIEDAEAMRLNTQYKLCKEQEYRREHHEDFRQLNELEMAQMAAGMAYRGELNTYVESIRHR